MKIVFKNNKISIAFLVIILIALNTAFLIQQKHLISLTQEDRVNDENIPIMKESANNDTTAPSITYIQPPENNSIIKKNYYEIIVNITDDNPPLPNNVIVQISNISTLLFNASMVNEEGNLWFFNWDNITSYANNEIYIIQVWAKDSSANGNYNWSGAYYILVTLKTKLSPGILNVAIYIFFVCVIFALIFVYFRKKSAFIRPTEKK